MPKPINIDSENVTINGYDPVSYFSGTAAEGDPDISAIHRGVVYRFANTDNKAKFTSNPEEFAPQYGGFCATAMSEGKIFEVDPTNFKITDGRLFLFYRGEDGDTLPEWNAEEKVRAAAADRHWLEDTYVSHE